MLTSGCRILNPDDYLLCFESENSFSAVACFVSDSWFGMLGEGAGLYPSRELQDVAVGRFPVTYAEEAKVLVDKKRKFRVRRKPRRMNRLSSRRIMTMRTGRITFR